MNFNKANQSFLYPFHLVVGGGGRGVEGTDFQKVLPEVLTGEFGHEKKSIDRSNAFSRNGENHNIEKCYPQIEGNIID